MSGWLIKEYKKEGTLEEHIVPKNDEDDHFFEECHCNPKYTEQEGYIEVIHYSFDGREAVEEFNKIINESKPFE